jgi:uncharacterized protein (TIGR02145 family)/uncharacterized repeat protein (TIGR02543 family)
MNTAGRFKWLAAVEYNINRIITKPIQRSRDMRAIVLRAVAVTALVFITAVVAVAQGTDTAYVPFVVNVNATVTAQQGEKTASMTVTANVEKTLAIPLGSANSVWNTGGAQGRLNAPIITNSRGNITLRLPPQSYQNAEIALHSVNGKRVLRAKAAASETVSGVSRRNVAPGVYMLSVKGTHGSAITTRLTHSGGDMNISVAFGAESVSPERRLEKKAADGDWDITVAADGYITHTYTFRPVVGINGMQVINLDPVSQAQTYTLTVSANPSAGGTVSPAVGAHTYDAGALVTVTATASSGYTFKNWSGASTSTSAAVNVMIDGNKTLTANFQQDDTPQPGNTFVDSRDGNVYHRVVIGNQVWMGENLNYYAIGSVCYDNRADSCAKYGRMYNWSTAMNDASSSSLSPSGVQGVCPAGWHIPSDAEWTTLTDYVGLASTTGTKLKSTSGWYNNGSGTDEYGWSALPGGVGICCTRFEDVGRYGLWWSATAYATNYNYAWYRYMYYNYEHVSRDYNRKSDLRSVRCVQD